VIKANDFKASDLRETDRVLSERSLSRATFLRLAGMGTGLYLLPVSLVTVGGRATRAQTTGAATIVASGEYPTEAAQVFITSATPFTLEAMSGDVQSLNYRFFPQDSTPPDYSTKIGTSAQFNLDGPDGWYEVDSWAVGTRGEAEAPNVQLVYLDDTAPTITIAQPTQTQYVHSDTITLDYTVNDGPGSGVNHTRVFLDGTDTLAGHDLSTGQAINLLTELSLGEHTFTVDAVDNLNGANTVSVDFTIIVTAESIKDEVKQFLASGAIRNQGTANSLHSKMDAAAMAQTPGNCTAAIRIYRALIKELQAQSGKSIDVAAARIMIVGAQYLIDHCR
jgi:hypothetical protein